MAKNFIANYRACDGSADPRSAGRGAAEPLQNPWLNPQQSRKRTEVAQDLGWYTFVVRKKRTRVMTIISSLLLLFVACIMLILFYPYTYNFTEFPRITHTESGVDGDPLNMVFVGRKEQILHSFQQAGWLIPDPITSQTSKKIAIASLDHRSYPTAPVSNLYVFGKVQDLAFEKPTTDVQNRGLVKKESYAAFMSPIVYARNGGGDYYESDGDVLVINYTTAPIQLQKPAWTIYGLKNGVFSVYDTLLTSLLFALVVGMLGLILVVVWLWLALSWLLKKHGPRVQIDRQG